MQPARQDGSTGGSHTRFRPIPDIDTDPNDLRQKGDERIWRQMNVHRHLYSFDAEGNPCGVASADNGNDRTGTKLSVTTPVPAAETAVCLYVVPCGLPESDRVSDSPPLKLTLRVLRDGTVIDTLERRVNQFGGDQLIGKRYK